MRRNRWLIMVVAFALVLAACSTGESSDTETPSDTSTETTAGAVGAGGTVIPETAEPSMVRDVVLDTMQGKRIAFVPISNEGFDLAGQWRIEMQRVFDNLGAVFETYDPAFDTDTMIQIIDGLIAEGVDALVLHNPDVGVLTEQIKAAQEAGIYVVVLNLISNQSADLFIGGDVTAMAADVANYAADRCDANGRNKVAVIDGWGADGWSIGANAGWDPVFEQRGLEVVSRQQGQYDPGIANEVATAVLQQNDDLCAFLVNWDIMSLGVGQAVATAGLTGEVDVYAIDASQLGCKAITDGTLTATAAYHVPGMGVAAAVALQSLFENQPGAGSTRAVTYVPHTIIDADNYDQVAMACYSSN